MNSTTNKNTLTTIDNEEQVKTIEAGQTIKGRGVRSQTRGDKGKQTQNQAHDNTRITITFQKPLMVQEVTTVSY